MGLYHNITHWDYNLEVGLGEHVAWIRNPFGESKLDPLCKVIKLYNNFSADLEVVQSSHMSLGTILVKQSLREFKRVKLTSIKEDLTYNKTI